MRVLTKNSNVTTGKVYWSVLQKERPGRFRRRYRSGYPAYHKRDQEPVSTAILPLKAQKLPLSRWAEPSETLKASLSLSRSASSSTNADQENVILIHVTLIPYLRASQEMKTKPTQASVKELQGMGIQPDIIVCRSEYPLRYGNEGQDLSVL